VTGVLLLLAALSVTAVLAFVLLAAVRARLRERAELERAARPGPPAAPPAGTSAPGQPAQPPPPPPAQGPKKPAFAPWAVVSGIAVVVATLTGVSILKSCEAIGARAREQREQQECWNSLTALARWFESDWDARKALPPAEAVPVSMAVCPLGNRFECLCGRRVMLGAQRVLVVETEPHRNGLRHAVVAEQKFLDAGKTSADYQSAGGTPTMPRSYPSGPGGYRVYYGQGYFLVVQVSEAQYETIRKEVDRD